jgi:hypothetical protein
MPGLDPGIEERWITGSSPVMTGGFCGAGKGALRTHANFNIFKQPKKRHCEPTGRANARPMTGSAKQSILPRRKYGLLRRIIGKPTPAAQAKTALRLAA